MSNLLEKASILTTPTAYNDGKLLSVKPTNVLGNELVTNGDFATDSDWSKDNSWSISGGKANYLYVSNRNMNSQSATLVVGRTYKLVYTILDYVSGNVQNNSASSQTSNSSNGTYTEYFVARFSFLRFRGSTNGNLSIDNVSVKEVTDGDFDFTRGSTATRVNSSGLIEDVQILSSELVTNGDFATDSDWSKGSNWSISNGSANADGSSGGAITQATGNAVVGKTYKVEYTVLNYVSGRIRFSYAGTSESFMTGNGTYTSIRVATNTNSNIASSSIDFIGSIDNVSVKEITEDTDLPRIDYTDGVGSILLEPQSTNLYLNSETLSTQNNSTTASSYTVSFYGTGTINLTGAFVGSLVGTGVNDRVSLTFTSTSSTLTSTISGSVNKAQLEKLSFASSYTPTSGGSTTTRLGETLNNAGSSDLINSTEGVLYLEIAALSDLVESRMSLNNGTNLQTIQIRQSGSVSNQYNIGFSNGSLNKFIVVSDITEYNKIAVSYNSSRAKIFINGTEVATDNAVTLPTGLNNLSFDRGDGTFDYYGNVKCVAVFKEALTDAELTCLTTI